MSFEEDWGHSADSFTQSGFLGNYEAKRRVISAIKTRRLPHALLIKGDYGTGKRTFAKLIARALVCTDKEGFPCGQCPGCVRALAMSHPDIRIAEGTGASRSISVETVKDITLDAYRMPEEAEVSVYLIFIENKISEAAQNKFLKLIEEPPDNTVFIFTCENSDMLLPTIRSRVEILALDPPNIEEAAVYIADKLELESNEALKLSTLCGGNIGRMFDEAGGNPDGNHNGTPKGSQGSMAAVQETAVKIAKGVMKTSGQYLLEATAPLIKDRKLAVAVFGRMALILRDACMLSAMEGSKASGKIASLSGAKGEAKDLSRMDIKKLMKLMEITEYCKSLVDRNVNMTMLITAYCAKLRYVAEH